jgi:hypothetical protein
MSFKIGANGQVYAPLIGAAFANLLPYHIRRILNCKRRDNYKWRIHNVELNPTPLQGRDSFHSIKVFNDKILIL